MEKFVTHDLQAFRVFSQQFKWIFCSGKPFEERSIAFQINKCGNVCRREENLFYFLDQVAYSQKFMR